MWYVVVVLVALLTGRQVADKLGVSNETVLRWALEGELPSIRDDVLPRREPAGPAAPSADVTFEDYCERFLERQTTAPSTVATLRDRLRSARQTFGRWTLAQLEYAAADIAAWRAGRCPKAQGSGTPAALRQCLAAAVRWRYLDRNPAVDAGTNAKPRSREIDPFDPDELAAIYAEFDVPDRQLVTSARETGLRPEEWCALRRADFDRVRPPDPRPAEVRQGPVDAVPEDGPAQRPADRRRPRRAREPAT